MIKKNHDVGNPCPALAQDMHKYVVRLNGLMESFPS
jgi:hypothetical protein